MSLAGLALVLSAAVLGAQSLPVPASARREVIRGRVTTDSSAALAGAVVTATRAPDRLFLIDTTDAGGRYEIGFVEGTGDYLVHFVAPGHKALRKRVTRAAGSIGDTVFVVDVVLEPNVQRLAEVKVAAQRPKPSRGGEAPHESGAAEQVVRGVESAIPPDQRGDLAAAAGTIPGVTLTPGGVSVLGLDAAQSSRTLNGMSFSGAEVPAGLQSSTRVTTSTWDPARGWFSGANVDVDVAGGSLFSHRSAYGTLDAPPLQATDPVSRRMGQRYTYVRTGGTASGPLDKHDRLFYAVGVDGMRRVADAASLLEADADLLTRAGVAADSARRLLAVMRAAGVPTGASGIPMSRLSESVVLLARLDHAPYEWKTMRPAKTTWGLTAYGKLGRSERTSAGPAALTATPGIDGRSRQAIASVQALYSFYFGNDWLSDTRTALSVTRDERLPYLRLPGGSVLVSSALDDTTALGGSIALRFGGGGAPASATRQWTWETTNTIQLYPSRRVKHRVKLDFGSRLDGVARDASGNALGSFSFNSLADLEAGRPASFTRTLNAPRRVGEVWNGFAALGDLWRASSNLSVLLGLRVEGNVFTRAPAYNPAVERLFGVRTAHAPNTVHASPRLGFSWRRRAGGTGFMVSPLGMFNLAPSGVLRGGIGEFRSMLPATLLADAATLTGLPGGTLQLTCIGAAAPTPDWTRYAAGEGALPTECLDGTPAFRDAAPAVELFDRRYTTPRSWRANLGYNSTLRKWITYAIDGTYSLNLNQPGMTDLNFAGVPRFTLANEGRPVFVSPGSIVASTGVVSPVEARRSDQYGRVVSHRSDLRSVSRAVTLTLMPGELSGRWHLQGSYTLASVRALASGFDGGAFGSPTAREWGRGDLDARHQLVIQAGITRWGLALTAFGRFTSGMPFTPVVGGDVNGDGWSNDRAFVFDPAASGTDPAVAAGMRSLLAVAPSYVRTCLRSQMRLAAARNSCEGPWTATMNAQLSVGGPSLRLGRGSTISLALANPLAGLDQLLHGSGGLHGWGAPPSTDPVLYHVRGFDGGRERFVYEVNPAFGGRRPAQSTLRAPFRATLSVSLRLGADIAQQQLDRFVRPGRNGYPGPRLTLEELKRRYARNVPDPYAGIIAESDSLLLARGQLEALQQAQMRYRARIDSLWTGLAEYLVQLPDRFDAAVVLQRQETVVDSAWVLSWRDTREVLPQILTPLQRMMLPYPAVTFLQMERPPKGWRNYYFGG